MTLTEQQIDAALEALDEMSDTIMRDYVNGVGHDGAYALYSVAPDGKLFRSVHAGPWVYEESVTIGSSPESGRWSWSQSLGLNVSLSDIVGPDGQYQTFAEAEADGWMFAGEDDERLLDWQCAPDVMDWSTLIEWAGKCADKTPIEEMQDAIRALGQTALTNT